MSDNWYYAKGRQRLGPFAFTQLQQLAAAQLLTPTDMVWNEGASYWAAAGDVPGLFSPVASVSSVSGTSPHPDPPSPASSEPCPEGSAGWDLVERGILSVADAPAAEPHPGERSRPSQRRPGEDFGECLVAASAPTPAGLPSSASRAGEHQQRGAPGREVIREVQPAQPRSSPRRKMDTLLTIAVALALLALIGSAAAFLGSFFLDGPFLILSGLLLILAGPLFLIVGMPVMVSGRVPYSRERFSGRPRYARLEGVAALLIGLGAASGGLTVVINSIQRDSNPPSPARAADNRSVGEPSLFHRLPAKQFHKAEKTVLLYQGKETPFCLWLVPGEWQQSKKSQSADAEVVGFRHKNGELFAQVIAQHLPMPRNTLRRIVVENALKADKDATIIQEETRLVNGTEVLCLTINGKSGSMPVTLHGYYYAGEQGTIQIVTVAPQNRFQESQPELERFLNGFEILKHQPE